MRAITVLYFSLFFIYGMIFGSFLNVCIYRIPQNLKIARGRSFCPSCNHTLRAVDLVPLISYLTLGGRCRYCKATISPRYAFVEVLTGVLFGLTYLSFGISFQAVSVCILACVLLTLAFIDIDTGEIPDRMHIIICALAIANICFANTSTIGFENPLLSYGLGFFVISLPMLIIACITGGFGGGDIKLMAAAGLFLGLWDTVLAFFIGAFFGGIYGIYLIIFKKAKGKSTFSFGPHLAAGIFISCLFGNDIISFYLRSVGF